MSSCPSCNGRMYVFIQVGKYSHKRVVCGCAVDSVLKYLKPTVNRAANSGDAKDGGAVNQPLIFWDDACALLVVGGVKMLILTEEDLTRAKTEIYRSVPPEERFKVMEDLTKAFKSYRNAATEKAIMRFMTDDR